MISLINVFFFDKLNFNFYYYSIVTKTDKVVLLGNEITEITEEQGEVQQNEGTKFNLVFYKFMLLYMIFTLFLYEFHIILLNS